MGYVYFLIITLIILMIVFFCLSYMNSPRPEMSMWEEFVEWFRSGDVGDFICNSKKVRIVTAEELVQDDILHSKQVERFIRKKMNQLNYNIKERNKNGYQFLECYVDTPSRYTTELRRLIREDIKTKLLDAGYYVEIKPDKDFAFEKAYFGEFFIQWGEKGREKRRAMLEDSIQGPPFFYYQLPHTSDIIYVKKSPRERGKNVFG